MARRSTQHRRRPIARLMLLAMMAGALMCGRQWPRHRSQRIKQAPSSTTRKNRRREESADAKKETVSDRDTIGFSQQNAASQMNELEDRMFRLSEALRGLEPENASRLRLALKFSREEQILEQMRENAQVAQGRAAQQGRDRDEGADRQARAPAQPAPGRGS